MKIRDIGRRIEEVFHVRLIEDKEREWLLAVSYIDGEPNRIEPNPICGIEFSALYDEERNNINQFAKAQIENHMSCLYMERCSSPLS